MYSKQLLRIFRKSSSLLKQKCDIAKCNGLARDRALSSAVPVSAVHENVWSSPYPEVQIPEVDLARYLLDDMGRYGTNVALADAGSGREVTYAELQTQIVHAASALSRMGVTQGDVITLFLPNCLEFPVMFLAANALGAVASAVNPLYTAGELEHALRHSRAKVLVTMPLLLPVAKAAVHNSPECKHIVSTHPAEGCRPFSSLVEDDGKAFPEHVDIDVHKDMVALPYSSGTTGLPKGVMLSHYNIIANIEQMKSPMVADYASGDVPSGVLPFFHIYGMNVILLLSLKWGLKVASMPKFDPEMYLKKIQQHKVTHLYVVPPIVLFLAQHPMVSQYDLSSVRSVVCGAAPVSEDMCAKLADRLTHPDLVTRQGYGMTETSPITHCCSPINVKLATVGQVVPNTLAKVVDPSSGETLESGTEGEICMKGPQVMIGYYKNEEATAGTIDEQGWIHTGDLGYVDEEGFFYVTDRMKELIKYKGLQVAPAELEALLIGHPCILDAAVIGVPDERAGELPRAYVVIKPGSDVTEEQVAQYVKENVASYKQLSGGVEIRAEIPKSASGKILRRILKDEYLSNC